MTYRLRVCHFCPSLLFLRVKRGRAGCFLNSCVNRSRTADFFATLSAVVTGTVFVAGKLIGLVANCAVFLTGVVGTFTVRFGKVTGRVGTAADEDFESDTRRLL